MYRAFFIHYFFIICEDKNSAVTLVTHVTQQTAGQVSRLLMAAKNPVPFLQKFIATWKGLDTALRGVKVISAGQGRATFSLTVEESQTNS